MDREYTYYAYISYKHGEDTRHAKWMQRKLDNYRLPSTVGESFSGKPFFPTFIDDEYLQAGPEEEQFKEHLAQSKYLIVICSKNAHDNPYYVNMEIRLFLETGHSVEQIIPLIVDETCDNPVEECFPSALQEIHSRTGILGSSFRNSSKKTLWGRKQDAFLNVVAKLLEVETAAIKRLDVRRKMMTAAIALVLVLLSGIGGGKYYYDHVMEHYSYYTDYVLINNVPSGVAPLTGQQLELAESYYAFTVVDDKVRQVEHLNFAGCLAAPEETVLNEGAARIICEYDGESLTDASYYDELGRLIVCYQYYEQGRHVLLTRGADTDAPSYLVTDPQGYGNLMGSKSAVSKYVQEYDEQGRIIRRRFARGDDFTPCVRNDSDEVSFGTDVESMQLSTPLYGYTFAYTDSGQLAEVAYMGSAQGEVKGKQDNVHSIAYAYDDVNGYLAAVEYRDVHGKPVNHVQGWARMEISLNAQTHTEERAYYAALSQQESLLQAVNLGQSEKTNLEPVMGPDGYASMVQRREGAQAIQQFYDTEGALLRYAVMELDMEAGFARRISYYDGNDRPVYEPITGAHQITVAYFVSQDRAAWTAGVAFLDEAGAPEYISAQNCAGYNITYTTENGEYREEITYFGQAEDISLEYLTVTRTFDTLFLNLLEESYTLIPKSEGHSIAGIAMKYDEAGREVLEYFFTEDDSGRSIFENSNSYAMMESSYRDGYLYERYYYDADGNLKIVEETGVSGVRMERNSVGNITRYSYLGTDKKEGVQYEGGNLTMCNEGYAVMEVQYDAYGLQSGTTYLNTDRIPVTTIFGHARNVVESDRYGNITHMSFYVLDGSGFVPVVNPGSGYAKFEAVTDERGNATDVCYYGWKNGAYVPVIESQTGIARTVKTYNEQGVQISDEYYGFENGAYVPIVPPGKEYAKLITEENAYGMTNIEFYGVEQGEFVPMVSDQFGFGKCLIQYNDRGEAYIWEFYGVESGKFVPAVKQGNTAVARYVAETDEQGRALNVEYYGAANGAFVPVVSEDIGCGKMVFRYDAYGNNIYRESYGVENGAFVLAVNPIHGWAVAEANYGPYGGQVLMDRVAYFDENRQPMVNEKAGFAEQVTEYDSQGNTLSITLYGVEREEAIPAVSEKYGFAKLVFEIDEAGNTVAAYQYGYADGAFIPVNNAVAGYAKAEWDYDGQGNVIAQRGYSYDGSSYQLIS